MCRRARTLFSTGSVGGGRANRRRWPPCTVWIPSFSWSRRHPYPKTLSEYDFFGGINGAPIEVFESAVTGLLLPANAEIIVEGYAHPGKEFREGPFGEFTG